ncbi:MAG: hypothetical protein OD814_001275 [Candidatus Alkanophagales archaeon MCA70_species_1]|nr:hypothetical protein [Candidatus Alkanophaga volatiphilum]
MAGKKLKIKIKKKGEPAAPATTAPTAATATTAIATAAKAPKITLRGVKIRIEEVSLKK